VMRYGNFFKFMNKFMTRFGPEVGNDISSLQWPQAHYSLRVCRQCHMQLSDASIMVEFFEISALCCMANL
jgi:hypothetical protein